MDTQANADKRRAHPDDVLLSREEKRHQCFLDYLVSDRNEAMQKAEDAKKECDALTEEIQQKVDMLVKAENKYSKAKRYQDIVQSDIDVAADEFEKITVDEPREEIYPQSHTWKEEGV